MEGARAAAERGDLAQFETLMIRANRPREVVQHYKDLGVYYFIVLLATRPGFARVDIYFLAQGNPEDPTSLKRLS